MRLSLSILFTICRQSAMTLLAGLAPVSAKPSTSMIWNNLANPSSNARNCCAFLSRPVNCPSTASAASRICSRRSSTTSRRRRRPSLHSRTALAKAPGCASCSTLTRAIAGPRIHGDGSCSNVRLVCMPQGATVIAEAFCFGWSSSKRAAEGDRLTIDCRNSSMASMSSVSLGSDTRAARTAGTAAWPSSCSSTEASRTVNPRQQARCPP